ncbi:HNH endonuclease [Paenibacillus humicus]|uniref:HNH endonuclease n=1 Tax=Paenibacillus humicus TaxID=412861 RepID=UPI003F142F7D
MDISVSKSAEIRKLHDLGVSTAEIAKRLGIRYQFAYNTITKYKNRTIAKHVDGVNVVTKTVRNKNTVGTRLFSRMNYQVRRGMMELTSIHQLSAIEWSEIKDFFEGCCAYCGVKDTGDSRNGLVADHLIPASQNGDFVIGNVISACHDCNDRRGNKPWESWLRQNYPLEAEQRVNVISQYLEKYPYKVLGKPEDRLTAEEWQKYQAIMRDWDDVWERARALRDQIASRQLTQDKGEVVNDNSPL